MRMNVLNELGSYIESMKQRQQEIKASQQEVNSLANIKDNVESIEQASGKNPVQIRINLDFMPGMIAHRPHIQALRVWNEQNPEGKDLYPSSDLILPQFEFYLRNKLGLDRSQEIFLGLTLVDEATSEMIPLRVDEKIGNLDIDETTTIGEIAQEIAGYSLYVMPATAGISGVLYFNFRGELVTTDGSLDTSSDF